MKRLRLLCVAAAAEAIRREMAALNRPDEVLRLRDQLDGEMQDALHAGADWSEIEAYRSGEKG